MPDAGGVLGVARGESASAEARGARVRLVGVCGSLRDGSLNAAVVATAAELCAEDGVVLERYRGIGALPFFNPDVETAGPPPAAEEWRAALAAADGVLVASPEYAHGTSGVLKNALEWVVGGGELTDKPVLVVTASPSMTGGDRAQAWVTETLQVMGARVLPEALAIPQASAKIDGGRVTDPPTRRALRSALTALTTAASGRPVG